MKKEKLFLKTGLKVFMINSDNLENHFSEIAALIGEKARAKMLWNLLDGRAYTATELAIAADISKQSCSNHLLKLVKADILVVEKQGRHKYYRFSNDRIAQVIESIAFLLPPKELEQPTKKQSESKGIKYARTCYDHLAGKIAIEITNSMLLSRKIIQHPDSFEVTRKGEEWLDELDISIAEIGAQKRKFAFPCLDWSERKPHIGGALGAAMLDKLLEKDWIRRKQHSREVIITGLGQTELRQLFSIEL